MTFASKLMLPAAWIILSATCLATSKLKLSGTSHRHRNHVAPTMRMPAPKVPQFSAFCGFPPSRVRTKSVATIESRMPAAATTSGSTT